MKRAVAAISVALAVATTVAAAGRSGSLPVRALNWNRNPLGCPRKPAWVRAETGYFFVSLAGSTSTLTELMGEARRTGCSTLVLLDWQEPPGSGFAELNTRGALWSSSSGIRLEVVDPLPTPKKDTPVVLARFSWKPDVSFDEFVRIDLNKDASVDSTRRPMMMLRLRASHAGMFLKLRLQGDEGCVVEHRLPIGEANRWTTFGPFPISSNVRGKALKTVHSIRLVKITPPKTTAEDVTVELADVRVSARAELLEESFVPRSELGTGKQFAAAIRTCRKTGGHVILDVDAVDLPHAHRLVAESLEDWVARTPEGAPAWSTDPEGHIHFVLRPDSGWSEHLARTVGEKLMTVYGADGVYLRNLEAPDADDEKSRKRSAAAKVLLERVRKAVKSTSGEGALFVDRATAATLRYADVAVGPPAERLKDFRYACVGILADVPLRSVRDVDSLHLTMALGLKLANDRTDLEGRLKITPGTLRTGVTSAGMKIDKTAASTGLVSYKRRLTEARGSCAKFFDFRRGARWRGRISTNLKGCEIMHFSVGREHLYTIANTGDKLTGPIVLDVSKLQADGFVDAVTGEIVPVRDGYLTVELEPHALAMLYTAVTTGRLFPIHRVTASDED